jgi:NTE family protein
MRTPRAVATHLAALAAALILGGCSSARPWLNEPLRPAEVVRYDGRAQFADPARAADILVVASFSGGGSRAAAFAHAALAELDARAFAWQGRKTSLAHEIDMVAGVSGGSVAAAHFALHGLRAHLARFPDDFLAVDFQSRLVGAALAPVNVNRMSSPWFGRGNVLAEELDAQLFAGATFGHLAALPGRPYLIVGATDLSNGAEFDFASDQFRTLCSSIDKVPLAFAVAASSSVPLVFSPLTLQNHSNACSAGAPGGLAAVRADTARARLVQSEVDSLAASDRRYVHLVDGGLSDNLGLRRIADYVAQAGGIRPVLAALQRGGTEGAPLPRRIVFVSVNSERIAPLAVERRGEVPGTAEVLHAMVYGGLGRYSRETSLVFSDAVSEWRRELQTAAASTPGADVDIYAIEINLSDLEDRELRERVLAIPTAFRITPEDLELLRRAAHAGVAQSPELARFLASTQRNPD